MLLAPISVLSLALVALASPMERRASPVITSCSKPKTAALTFDDGPYIYMKDIVNALDNAGVKGTFFVNGNNWDCIYDPSVRENVKYAYDHGHQIASHTWAHKDLASLSWDQVHDEMWRVEQAVQRITGAYPAFTRPPYGSYNDNVRNVADVRGETLINWDFDSGDSEGASVNQQKSNYDGLVGRHPNTILSLQHETYETSAHQVIPYAIQKLKGAGYNLVTVAECLGRSPYQSVGSPGTPDSSWTC